ncbi:MAG: metal ABC transporter permease [Patescibacteria group bacterium]
MNINEIYFLILALISAVATGLVGSFALMKRMTLAGDAFSHVALPGLGLGILFGINPLLGGAATLVLGALIVWHLEKRSGLATETTIGVVFSASLAIGALITPSEDLIEALFGNFAPLSLEHFLIGLTASFLIILFILKFKDQLVIALFSPELASSSGINLSRLNLLYLLIFTLTIILGLRFLGALLVGSLIIIPAAASRQLTHQLNSFLITSSLLSAASVAIGIFISRSYAVAFSPAVVSVSAVIFAASLLKKKR